MSTEETDTAATVAEQGAHVAQQKASSKKGARPKKGAPKGHEAAKGRKTKAAAPKKEAKTSKKTAKSHRKAGAVGNSGLFSGENRKPAAAGAGAGTCGWEESLLSDLVDPLAGFALRGLDLDPLLLGCGGEEPAHAVRLPLGDLHDLGERGALGPSDQVQDLRALPLGAWAGGGSASPNFIPLDPVARSALAPDPADLAFKALQIAPACSWVSEYKCPKTSATF